MRRHRTSRRAEGQRQLGLPAFRRAEAAMIEPLEEGMEAMMESAEAYRAMVVASEEQRRRRQLAAPPTNRWDSAAARFREDPRRPPDDNLQAIASYVRPDDIVLDVGGGAGRYSLPLALLCREVVNIEPSPGMGSEFEGSAKEAGIENARLVETDWLGA